MFTSLVRMSNFEGIIFEIHVNSGDRYDPSQVVQLRLDERIFWLSFGWR